MNLTEKRQKILELIQDEMNFVTNRPTPSGWFQIIFSQKDFNDLEVSYSEAEKVFDQLEQDEIIISYLLYRPKNGHAIDSDFLITVDEQKFLNAIPKKFEFDKNGFIHYGNIKVKFQKGSDQHKFLDLLFKHRGTIIVFKEISKVIWQKDDDSKPQQKKIRDLVSKILKKFRDKNITDDPFETSRGYGIIQ